MMSYQLNTNRMIEGIGHYKLLFNYLIFNSGASPIKQVICILIKFKPFVAK